MKKKNVRFVDRRSDANLSRGLYRPLDQRKFRDEPVLPRVFNSQFGPHLEHDGYEIDEFPADHYQLNYAT